VNARLLSVLRVELMIMSNIHVVLQKRSKLTSLCINFRPTSQFNGDFVLVENVKIPYPGIMQQVKLCISVVNLPVVIL